MRISELPCNESRAGAPVDGQDMSRDKAPTGRCQEHRGLSHLFGPDHAAQRYAGQRAGPVIRMRSHSSPDGAGGVFVQISSRLRQPEGLVKR